MSEAGALLEQAIPGRELRRGRRYRELARRVPQAWKFWRGSGSEWAVFVLLGEHLSQSDHIGILAARRARAIPVLVASELSAVRAASAFYRKFRPHLICDIAGRGSLIAPPSRLPRRCASGLHPAKTRISLDLFEDLVKNEALDSYTLTGLKLLVRRYSALAARRKGTDDAEGAALMQFAERILDGMGLQKARIKTTRMLRTVEGGGLTTGRRDHFFHSFQNYFLGLRAVVELRREFETFKQAKKLNWDISPIHVWFLTAMWHDVGYAVQSVGSVVDAVLGEDDADDVGDSLKERFLHRTATDEALRLMSSLISRLLSAETPRTGWLAPGPRTNLGQYAARLRDAFQKNILESHGVASAVRLFCDHRDDLDKMDPDPSEVLKQTVYLACCSIPFHDWNLRQAIRETCGTCQLETVIMPFAALLAFVDSIQDDRRDLGASRQAALILRRLLVRRSGLVQADIDPGAIPEEALIGKMIEARDVLASLLQPNDGLRFKYPSWMSGQR